MSLLVCFSLQAGILHVKDLGDKSSEQKRFQILPPKRVDFTLINQEVYTDFFVHINLHPKSSLKSSL